MHELPPCFLHFYDAQELIEIRMLKAQRPFYVEIVRVSDGSLSHPLSALSNISQLF